MNLRESFGRSILDKLVQFNSSYNIHVNRIGQVRFGKFEYFLPQVVAHWPQAENPKDILLSGLVHGDEPAGGLAIIRFLEERVTSYLKYFNFHCYPCVNPSGFETRRRENMLHVNLNRDFSNASDSQEVRLILEALRQGPPVYAATIDLHECDQNAIDPKEDYLPADNPSEFWMWETATLASGLRIGEKVINDMNCSGIPVCRWPKIYGDMNNSGVIWYPEGNDNKFYVAGTSFDGYLYNHYTNHSFTLETPTHWLLERRIDTHVRAICSILDHLKGLP